MKFNAAATGAFYGMQSLRQLLAHADSSLELPGVRVRDWPHKALRGVKLYLPALLRFPG